MFADALAQLFDFESIFSRLCAQKNLQFVTVRKAAASSSLFNVKIRFGFSGFRHPPASLLPRRNLDF